MEAHAGTVTMVRLALRRDRVLLPAWIVGLVLMAAFSASATADLYPTAAARIEAATTFNASAAIVALYGRVYDPSSLGALSMIKLSAFGSALIGILMVFVAVRHTRAEEETGRLELLSGGRLGRLAPVTSTLLLGAGSSVLLGLLAAIGNTAAGLPAGGSFAFGAGWAATGIVFTTVGIVAAQLTTGARAARGLGLMVVLVAYVLRALGDLAEPGPSALSWLSPIGWSQQIRAYAGDRWAVLALPLLLAAALVPVAYAIRMRRDLGAGLRGERPGPARGRMGTVAALARRLQGNVLLAWTVAFVLMGIVLGSLASSVDDLLTSARIREFMERLGGKATLVDTFLGAELAIVATIAAAYGVSAAARLRDEEEHGRAEVVLATPASRTRWAASHYVIALGGVALLMSVMGVSLGLAAAASLGDSTQGGRVLATALVEIPAAWTVTAVVMAVFGWAPRLTSAVWGLLVALVALGEFGALWGAPQWVMDLSPFEHVAGMPVASDVVVPVACLVLATAVLSVAGFAGWRRRDLAGA